MKLSTALATLLLAQRGVAGFAPPPAFVRGNGIHSSTARSIFVDPSWFETDNDKEEASSTMVATVTTSGSSEKVVEEEKFVDPAVGRLMDKLGLSDKQIYGEYLKWCMEFRKTPSTDRYEVFQLNFLLQQDYGFETNEYFNLNEYGDCTEGEYDFGTNKSVMMCHVFSFHSQVLSLSCSTFTYRGIPISHGTTTRRNNASGHCR